MNPRTLILTGLLLPGLLVVLAPCAAASATWYVDGVSGSDINNCVSPSTACKTIGHAISLASSGDSIMIAPATYIENLTINFSLNLIGSGASTTIIDGGGVNRVVNVSNGNVTLSGFTIRHGALVSNGAGILNNGNLSVIASTISGNSATNNCSHQCHCSALGGGIYNSNLANLTIRDTTLTGNSAASSFSGPRPPCASAAFGGGIFNNGIMTMGNSTLASNGVASGGYSFGGGISNGGTTTISNSNLSGNHSSWMSGGIDNGGTAIISNSTLSGNSATAQGGGIRNLGSATVSNSTLSGNAANLGGDIRNLPGLSMILQNTIVANSTTGGNCSGTMTSNGYNLSSDGTCNFNRPGDLNNQDPLLGPLQNNGGPTETMALLPGSPAIDAGNPSGCTDGQGNLLKTDQRGMPRPDRKDTGGCDMGAYESQSD